MDRSLARLRTDRLDAALAVAFTFVGLVQVVLVPIATIWVGVLYVVATTAPLAWRRSFPVLASLVASAMWVVPTDGFPIFGFVVAILMFFALGCYGAPRAAVWAVTVFASTIGAVGTLLGPEQPVTAIGAVLVVLAPVVVGLVVARLRAQNDELRRLAGELRAERRKVEEAAIGSERARIAQDLHDVVGHEVTLMAIQAEAASAALKVDPSRAVDPVETIRVTAHRTLSEIRAVLGVLAPEARTSSEDDVAALSRRADVAGIPNTVVVTGTPWRDLSPSSLAVNRIVRECLTNAGRHAPGQRVSVSVLWSDGEARVRASNPVVAGGDGHPVDLGRGLTAIRHRAELLGGTFDAVVDGGTFDVRVVLPAPASGTVPADAADEAVRR